MAAIDEATGEIPAARFLPSMDPGKFHFSSMHPAMASFRNMGSNFISGIKLNFDKLRVVAYF
jgi:hypothetical protein